MLVLLLLFLGLNSQFQSNADLSGSPQGKRPSFILFIVYSKLLLFSPSKVNFDEYTISQNHSTYQTQTHKTTPLTLHNLPIRSTQTRQNKHQHKQTHTIHILLIYFILHSILFIFDDFLFRIHLNNFIYTPPYIFIFNCIFMKCELLAN